MAIETAKLTVAVVLAPGGDAGIACTKLSVAVVLANNPRSSGGKTRTVVSILT
jgi:hypothetical protein